MMIPAEVPIERLDVSAYTVPADEPQSDGTLEWDAMTLVLVEAHAGGKTGIGYTYADASIVRLIDGLLAPAVKGVDAMDTQRAWHRMVHQVRNVGRQGLASGAVSAVDTALWDLKARLLDLPVSVLLGPIHHRVLVYGSGGYTSYDILRLQKQLAGWVDEGIGMVKMKVGREPAYDLDRVDAARDAIGDAQLFVDANGAYERKQALAFAEAFLESDVTWFEEPVSSDDLQGLRLLRDRAPAGTDITAGEYGYDIFYFRRMLEAGAVDVLQIDAGRCGGFTGFLRAAAVAEAFSIPISSHTAPQLHAHVCCAAKGIRHIEYFAEHVRIEDLLFDGVLVPVDGALSPDRSRPGMGLSVKRGEAEEYRVG